MIYGQVHVQNTAVYITTTNTDRGLYGKSKDFPESKTHLNDPVKPLAS